MNCKQFQKRIPDIMKKQLSADEMDEAITHVRGCEDCYEELEINYVLSYGLTDSARERETLNVVAVLEKDLKKMQQQVNHTYLFRKTSIFVRICSTTALLCSFVYVLFMFILK